MKTTNELLKRLRAWAPSRQTIESNPALRALAPHLADPKLWHWSRRGVAAGVAIGLFIGLLLPVAQILAAAVIAVLLRANVPLAAGTTLITNPLTVPPIYYVAYQIGARLTGHATPEPFSLADPVSLLDNLQTIGATLFLGLGVSATLAALASYFLISGVWAWRIAAARRSPKHWACVTF